jgi:hypothetical protein
MLRIHLPSVLEECEKNENEDTTILSSTSEGRWIEQDIKREDKWTDLSGDNEQCNAVYWSIWILMRVPWQLLVGEEVGEREGE